MPSRKRKWFPKVVGLRKRKFKQIPDELRMELILKHRRFVPVNEISHGSNYIKFTICSYNILAQYQIANNMYLYSHCDPKILEWENRWNNIKNDLKSLDCDIFCLQEVQFDHYSTHLEPTLNEMGYTGYLSRKTGPKRDGCAIFIKTRSFDINTTIFETINFNQNGIKSDNVAQLALLSPIDHSDSKVCVANFHSFFNPNRGEIKLTEMSIILSRLDILANSKRCSDRSAERFYWPIIFCGDFNMQPMSMLYDFVVNGHCNINNVLASDVSGQNPTSFYGKKSRTVLSANDLPPRIGITDQMVFDNDENTRENQLGSGILSHLLRLRSAQQHFDEKLYTAFTSVDSCAVDFIFYRHIEEKVAPFLELCGYLSLLTLEEFRFCGGIPNQWHGSDHIPIVAKFNLHV